MGASVADTLRYSQSSMPEGNSSEDEEPSRKEKLQDRKELKNDGQRIDREQFPSERERLGNGKPVSGGESSLNPQFEEEGSPHLDVEAARALDARAEHREHDEGRRDERRDARGEHEYENELSPDGERDKEHEG